MLALRVQEKVGNICYKIRNSRSQRVPESTPTLPWLPKLNPALTPRLQALLEPGSVAHDSESAEMHVRAILEDARQGRATDIHFDPCRGGWRVRLRVDGCLHDAAQLSTEMGGRIMRYIRIAAGLDPVVSFTPEDASCQFALTDHTLDLRLATAPCAGGEKLTLRLLDPQRLEHRIQDLGLRSRDLEVLRSWLGELSGMFLVTGPAGSGKTTTLYGLIHELQLSSHAVVTIEDPVEYPIDGVSQIQVDFDHGLTFAAGLKAMLRLDPDYLLVGEMRDSESAQIAIEAAASGHCVMSTLHSPDTAGVMTLLRNWGISDHQIASALQIVVNQRLVRRLCQACRKRSVPSKNETAWLQALEVAVPGQLWTNTGCAACQNTGYHDRIGVFEVWRKHDSDYELILMHSDEHSMRRHLRSRGLQSVLDDALARVQEGITSLAEIQSMGVHHSFVGARQPHEPAET